MISFPEWREVYEPLYGALANESLYRAHEALESSAHPERYRELIPHRARKVLGEFYTPAWLVERVYERAGYRGGTVLDPACGCGAFLAPRGAEAVGWEINPLSARMARAACPEARVMVRDAFAAGKEERFEFIAGNPPWVNWRHLGAPYRDRIASLWTAYRLFTQRGIKARLGAAMDDLSSLMTYVCADRYLEDDGRLAFILPAALFQSAGGGAAFRRFELPGNRFLRVVSVEEIDGAKVFEGAMTRPAIAVFEKCRTATVYPVPYLRRGEQCEARPVARDPTSPWSVAPPSRAGEFDELRGESPYVARVGAHTGGAAGVFWVDVLEDHGATLLIRNRGSAGKNKFAEVTVEVERELVHPLVRGRDLRDGEAHPSAHILLPHSRDGRPIEESRMAAEYPKTFAYFERFRDFMLARPHYRQHFAKQRLPYWSMYNVGPYTFAEHRVAWPEQTSKFTAARLAPGHIADAKLATVAVGSVAEAVHVETFLNSEPVRAFIDSYVVRTQISTHIMRYVRVPPFTP